MDPIDVRRFPSLIFRPFKEATLVLSLCESGLRPVCAANHRAACPEARKEKLTQKGGKSAGKMCADTVSTPSRELYHPVCAKSGRSHPSTGGEFFGWHFFST